jgi:hypothetical protein
MMHEGSQAAVQQGRKRLVAERALEHQRGMAAVLAGLRRRGACALVQQRRHHLRARAGQERGQRVVAAVVGLRRATRKTQFIQLGPVGDQGESRRADGQGNSSSGGSAGGLAVGTPSGGPRSQLLKGGARAPSPFGTMRSAERMSRTQASFAARVSFPPCHWARSREPSRLKPGHSS